jgi:hypothetical protein
MLGACFLVLGIAACGDHGGSEDSAALSNVQQTSFKPDASTPVPERLTDTPASGNVQQTSSEPDAGTPVPERLADAPGTVQVPQLTEVALTAEGMRADMAGPHESHIVGLPPAWSWGSQADPGFGLTGFPSGWTQPAYTFWGIVGASASGSPSKNARVQIRNLRADFKRHGSWFRAQYQQSNFSGANYTDYSTNTSVKADVRNMGSEGMAVRVVNSGGHYHFYPSNRVPFYRDLQALVVSMEVRLIKDDPNGPDDLDSARIYGVAAGDVYQSMAAQWNGTTWVNGHAPIGRFRHITREWRTITAHLGMSTDAQFNEYIGWAAQQSQ